MSKRVKAIGMLLAAAVGLLVAYELVPPEYLGLVGDLQKLMIGGG